MNKCLVPAIVALAGSLTAAQAQTFLNETFNSASGTVNGWQGGAADVANMSRAYVDGVGVGGTRALQISADFLSWGGYVAAQYQKGDVSGSSGAFLANTTLSFDIKVSNPGLTSIEVGFETWADNWWGGTHTGTRKTDVVLGSYTPDTFQTITLNLDDPVWTGTFNPAGGTYQTYFQVNSWNWAGPANGRSVTVDNLQLTIVPEPSSCVLAGVGALGWLLFRRNRKS